MAINPKSIKDKVLEIRKKVAERDFEVAASVERDLNKELLQQLYSYEYVSPEHWNDIIKPMIKKALMVSRMKFDRW